LLSRAPTRFFSANPIENMNGALHSTARNVKRWKDESMVRRWVASAPRRRRMDSAA
jgi:hypothetical protein